MRLRIVLGTLIALLMCGSLGFAGDDGHRLKKSAFTHHIGLFNVMTSDDPRFVDADYHFTLMRVGRFRFAGGGIGLDLYRGTDAGGDRSTRMSPYLTASLVDVALNEGRKPGDAFWSLGIGYAYTLRAKDHGFTVGFSRSWAQTHQRKKK